MTTATHLIAIDTASGLLWGAARLADGPDALRADVLFEADSAKIQDYHPETDANVPVSGEDIWQRCLTYAVVLTDSEHEPPCPDARLVYSGHALGWLPRGNAAWVLPA